jgi:hypothetical protein
LGGDKRFGWRPDPDHFAAIADKDRARPEAIPSLQILLKRGFLTGLQKYRIQMQLTRILPKAAKPLKQDSNLFAI